MNQRERMLTIAVGGMGIVLGLWWGIGKYRDAIDRRESQIVGLENSRRALIETQMQGELANRQMGEYLARSLPSDVELASSRYQRWLLDLVEENQLESARVTTNGNATVDNLYHRLAFIVQGRTDVPNLVHLLHSFYAKDYLHSIRDMTINKRREGGFDIKMSIDVIALLAASDELVPSPRTAWRVEDDVAVYLEPILNRNFFEPPNQAPSFSGQRVIEAIIGRNTPAPVTFKDPEDHQLAYELLELPPDFVSLDSETGTLTIDADEIQEFQVRVRATDNGYPSQSSEQSVTVKVVEPPARPVESAKVAFDESTQTVLTALVQGRDEWTAWMHVRTRDTILKLRAGDRFEIGTLKGEIVSVDSRSVTVEIDGRQFSFKNGGNLGEAARESLTN